MGALTQIKTKTTAMLLAMALVLVGPILSSGHALAASGTLTLSPASGSVSQGSILTVYVYENSGGDSVDAAQVNLSYPATLLDFVSISSSSAFSTVGNSSGGGGSVSIARAAIPAVSGSQLVASVRFKAKTSSGSAAINFASGSTLVKGGAEVPTTTRGATYALAPAPVAAPAPPKDTTSPTISNIKVSEITNNTATVAWTTSEPSTSGVDYGPTTSYGLAAGDTANVTEHKLVLNSAILRPGETYHYVVKSVDPAGNAVSGKDQTFKTAGLNMTVTVTDKKSKPVAGAKVSFQGQTVKTDAKGKAVLKGLKLDKSILVVSQASKETSSTVEVVQTAANLAKPVTIKINVAASSKAPLYIFVVLFMLAIGSLGYFLRRAKSGEGGSRVITPAPIVPAVDPDLKAAGPAPEEFKPTPTSPIKDNEPVIIKPDKPADTASPDKEE